MAKKEGRTIDPDPKSFSMRSSPETRPRGFFFRIGVEADREIFSQILFKTGLQGALLGLVASLYFIGGISGYAGHPVLNGIAAATAAFAALFFLYFFARLWERSRLGSLLWVLILSVFILQALMGLVPPTARDELTHHLAIPRLYAASGRIFEIPFAPYSYYPMLLDMFYTPWVRWGWDSVPKIIHGLFAFLTGLLVYTYTARRLSAIYGLVGFFFFVSTPVVLRLSHWAYVDLGLTFYAALSLLSVLRWLEERKQRMANGERRNSQSTIRNPQSVWLVLAGFSAGFALATKPNGLLVFLLLLLLLAWALARQGGRVLRQSAGFLFIFSLLALVPFSPWLARNFVWTGNPFFPFFTPLFGGLIEEGMPGLGILAQRRLLYGESWWEIAALPLRVFFFGQDDKPQYFDGVLSPILVLFLPWAFKGKWPEEKKLLFAFALLFFLYAFFLTDLRIRYLLPIVPPLVILLVYGIHNLYLRVSRPWILFAAILLLCGLNGAHLWDYFQKASPLEYLFSGEGRKEYLSRRLAEYPAIQYVNQNLPPTAKIYLLFIGRRTYYLERDYFHDTGDHAGVLLRMIQSAQNEENIRFGLRERGITHLLARDELLIRFLNDNLTPDKREMWVFFANRHLRALFHSDGYSVYQVHG